MKRLADALAELHVKLRRADDVEGAGVAVEGEGVTRGELHVLRRSLVTDVEVNRQTYELGPGLLVRVVSLDRGVGVEITEATRP